MVTPEEMQARVFTTYSIEHIMPQHLTPIWQKELGDEYEQIHDIWLHRIANLTLTAYNSKYSNNSFTEKKNMPNGFKDSGIRMNAWIANKDKWTIAELEERNGYLKDRALQIWGYPATEYKPEEKQLDTYTLEDEGELTGRLIAKFTFKKTEQPVTSWVEMYQKVIQILYAEDKSIITKLALSEEENVALHFNTKSDAFAKSAEIVFDRGDKQENKDAFDSLHAHKSEIESKLGTKLQWDRGDDKKSSKVFLQLDNVSIENETDWLRMARFHAE